MTPAISIGMALAGFGYWSLVASVIAVPACLTIGAWIATRWVPGLPRRASGISSMLRFGGTVSLSDYAGKPVLLYFSMGPG